MAKKFVNIGPFGPFIYDDSNNSGVKTDGTIEAANIINSGLSANIRLVFSDGNKKLVEVNDLTPFISGGSHIDVTDDGDGSVTLSIKNHLEVDVISGADSPYDISVTALRSIVIIDASANAVTANLPLAANWAGQTIVVKKTDNVNNVTIQANGTETIDGASSKTLTGQYDAITLVSDGVEVWIIHTQ